MRFLRTRLYFALSIFLATAAIASDSEERHQIRLALTFDDLPWVGPLPEGDSKQALERIAAVLRVHEAPATGFVVCERAGDDPAALRAWTAWGNTLGELKVPGTC